MNADQLFQKGRLAIDGLQQNIESLDWHPHAVFKGVFMKDIIRGESTSGRLSCHLVRIEPGYAIGDHIHDGRMEMHEVISGSGTCYSGDKVIAYTGGVVSIIPDNLNHRIEAGESGLFFLARFCPALV